MPIRLPSRKTSALVLVGIVITYLLFAWLALPRILQAQSEKFIAEKTGCRLTMNRPQFNPFTSSLRLSGLRLVQSDGKPLLVFRELVVNMSVASIVRGAYDFDDIHLDGLEATVDLLPHGRLNWSELIDPLKSKKKTSESALPRLDIHHLALTGARLDFSDKRTSSTFTTRFEPINLELSDISTLSSDKGQYKISASTLFGARVALQGQVSLEPVAMTGNVSLENVELSRLPSSVKSTLPINPAAGLASVSADYRLGYDNGRLEFNLERLAAKLANLKIQEHQKSSPSIAVNLIEAKDGRFDLTKNVFSLGALAITGTKFDLPVTSERALKALEVGSLVLEDTRIDLATHQAALAHIGFKDGQLHAVRDEQGRIDLMEALRSVLLHTPHTEHIAPTQTDQVNAKAAADAAWRYRLGKIDLSSFAATFRDEEVKPSAELALNDISISLEGISEDKKAAIPIRASFKLREGGAFDAEGQFIQAGPSADIRLKLIDLNLLPAQPYLNQVAKLKLEKGLLSTAGRVYYNTNEINYRGGFSVNDLSLIETDTGKIFLAWKSLGSRAFAISPAKLDMSELTLDGIDTQLIINKDKSVNLSRILKKPEAAPASAIAPASTTTPKTAKSEQPFLVNIDRLRVTHGELNYADYSLALPFGTRIHHLNGVVTGLSSNPNAPGQMEMSGQVDDYGLARALGQIDIFNPTNFLDLKVIFKNVEMTRLTPYSATFAGRKIASGKLSLNLEYKIKKRQLQGDNQIIMDQLTLGERVESPEAKDLPLDLAIAILQDSNGRIDLGLPVSGDMNDPQFSYGSILWKAFTNVLAKIATAPFRALGSLFGSSGEKFENITFEAGNPRLTPPEREKLAKLADALIKRPKLSLAIHGVYSDVDLVALQDLQLRRAVAEKIGISLDAKEDPGPMSTSQPKVQAALEDLYVEHMGKAELAAIKEGFRKANPGQMEQSTGGKLISRLSGAFQEKRSLSEQEVAQLEGADFYAVLYDRLRNQQAVGDVNLQALAKARGESMAKGFMLAGVPVDRIGILPAEKVEAENGVIPVKLVLSAETKPVASAPGNTTAQ